MSANTDRVAALIRDFGDLGGDVLQEQLQLPSAQAKELGLRIAQRVCSEYKGILIYIPAGFAAEISERDQALYVEHCKGRDAADLAQEFGLSVQQIYKRLRLVGAQEQAKRQPGLFDGES